MQTIDKRKELMEQVQKAFSASYAAYAELRRLCRVMSGGASRFVPEEGLRLAAKAVVDAEELKDEVFEARRLVTEGE